MKALLTQSAVGDFLGRVPFLPQLYAKRIWHGRMDHYFGVYGSYEEAEAVAARFATSTWDDDTLAAVLVEDAPDTDRQETKPFRPSYYPYLLWLMKVLKPGEQIVDLGGAGGIGFEIFTRYAQMPERARWHIVDVPALTARGRSRHGEDHPVLSFGEALADAPDCDVLVSAGCIQYMRDPLGEIAQMIERPKAPTYVLLNKVPLTPGPTYWTLQNLVSVVSPYQVFNRDRLIAFFHERGYKVRDEWTTPDISVNIPFHSDKVVPHLDGFMFVRADTDDRAS